MAAMRRAERSLATERAIDRGSPHEPSSDASPPCRTRRHRPHGSGDVRLPPFMEGRAGARRPSIPLDAPRAGKRGGRRVDRDRERGPVKVANVSGDGPTERGGAETTLVRRSPTVLLVCGPKFHVVRVRSRVRDNFGRALGNGSRRPAVGRRLGSGRGRRSGHEADLGPETSFRRRTSQSSAAERSLAAPLGSRARSVRRPGCPRGLLGSRRTAWARGFAPPHRYGFALVVRSSEPGRILGSCI
jgi:hypothetical protein